MVGREQYFLDKLKYVELMAEDMEIDSVSIEVRSTMGWQGNILNQSIALLYGDASPLTLSAASPKRCSREVATWQWQLAGHSSQIDTRLALRRQT